LLVYNQSVDELVINPFVCESKQPLNLSQDNNYGCNTANAASNALLSLITHHLYLDSWNPFDRYNKQSAHIPKHMFE
jgi:hypothetical protein